MRKRKVFGARIKIMWEWKLVDPLIHYIIQIDFIVNVPHNITSIVTVW